MGSVVRSLRRMVTGYRNRLINLLAECSRICTSCTNFMREIPVDYMLSNTLLSILSSGTMDGFDAS